jgi:ubiquinone/menaquinone biosynthesis C-methylase UbiE
MKLEGAVLDGAEKVLSLDAVYTDPVRNRAFNHAMRAHGQEGAADLLSARSFKTDRAVLDVGGGPGVIAAEICARRSRLRWTILDRPAALSLARRRVRADGLTDRIRCVGGDVLSDRWPNGHDTVLMSHLIHCFGEKDCRLLISHAAKVLPRGGTLVIRDFIPRRDRSTDHWAGLFALNMLVNTHEGRVYSLPTLRRLLAPAFRVEKVVDASRSQVLIARRR